MESLWQTPEKGTESVLIDVLTSIFHGGAQRHFVGVIYWQTHGQYNLGMHYVLFRLWFSMNLQRLLIKFLIPVFIKVKMLPGCI